VTRNALETAQHSAQPIPGSALARINSDLAIGIEDDSASFDVLLRSWQHEFPERNCLCCLAV
jgi:hypothetical protein